MCIGHKPNGMTRNNYLIDLAIRSFFSEVMNLLGFCVAEILL